MVDPAEIGHMHKVHLVVAIVCTMQYGFTVSVGAYKQNNLASYQHQLVHKISPHHTPSQILDLLDKSELLELYKYPSKAQFIAHTLCDLVEFV